MHVLSLCHRLRLTATEAEQTCKLSAAPEDLQLQRYKIPQTSPQAGENVTSDAPLGRGPNGSSKTGFSNVNK